MAITERLDDLTHLLRTVGTDEGAVAVPHGRGDELKGGGSGPDPRSPKARVRSTRDRQAPSTRAASNVTSTCR